MCVKVNWNIHICNWERNIMAEGELNAVGLSLEF